MAAKAKAVPNEDEQEQGRASTRGGGGGGWVGGCREGKYGFESRLVGLGPRLAAEADSRRRVSLRCSLFCSPSCLLARNGDGEIDFEEFQDMLRASSSQDDGNAGTPSRRSFRLKTIP